MDNFLQQIKDESIACHMENQPWEVTCKLRGKDLAFEKILDKSMDLSLIVSPCVCQLKTNEEDMGAN